MKKSATESRPDLRKAAEELIQTRLGMQKCTEEDANSGHKAEKSCYLNNLIETVTGAKQPIKTDHQPTIGHNTGTKHLIQKSPGGETLVICDSSSVQKMQKSIEKLFADYSQLKEKKYDNNLLSEIEDLDKKFNTLSEDFMKELFPLLSHPLQNLCPYVGKQKKNVLKRLKMRLSAIK